MTDRDRERPGGGQDLPEDPGKGVLWRQDREGRNDRKNVEKDTLYA